MKKQEQANECYTSSRFEDAAQLYNDCLVALDFDGTEAENTEARHCDKGLRCAGGEEATAADLHQLGSVPY